MAKNCFRHLNTVAMTVCGHCAQPICQQCMIYRDGAVFCGEECAIRRKALGEELRSSLTNASGPGIFGLLIRIIILGAVILGILDFFDLAPGIDFIHR